MFSYRKHKRSASLVRIPNVTQASRHSTDSPDKAKVTVSKRSAKHEAAPYEQPKVHVKPSTKGQDQDLYEMIQVQDGNAPLYESVEVIIFRLFKRCRLVIQHLSFFR